MTARRRCVAIGRALTVIGLAGSSGASDPPKIRIGWPAAPTHHLPVTLNCSAPPGHYGTTSTVQPVHFRGSTPHITALAAGELDIVMPAYFSFALAVLNARMDDLRVIADGRRDGVPGHWSGPFYLRAQRTVRNRGSEASGAGVQRHRRRHLSRVGQDHAHPNLDAMRKNPGLMREFGLLKIHAT